MRSVAGIINQRYFDKQQELREKNAAKSEGEAARQAAEMRKNQPEQETTDNMVD